MAEPTSVLGIGFILLSVSAPVTAAIIRMSRRSTNHPPKPNEPWTSKLCDMRHRASDERHETLSAQLTEFRQEHRQQLQEFRTEHREDLKQLWTALNALSDKGD